ncbi:hypothetical protein BDN72DRAFT_902635 [Pluteus cervinus]|uniref:Uncharacterized protein n=1 Tax=Pluteus cervinus TaxID=181527 RepID=A0ACD3ABS7_9AGAR|nr:hypothetical protein BDN72DRAFT_902635 [Pluteus cervinus]
MSSPNADQNPRRNGLRRLFFELEQDAVEHWQGSYSTLKWIPFKLLLFISFFGLPVAYLRLYQAPLLPSVVGAALIPGAASNINAPIRWPQLSRRLKKEWRLLNCVCLVLLPLNATLLQVNDVTSRGLTRTTTVLSLWFSIASLTCGCMNLLWLTPLQDIYHHSLVNARHQTLVFWDLWIVMTLPTLFFIWASLNFFVTAVVYSFSGTSNSPGDGGGETARRIVVAVALAFIGLSMLAYLPVLGVEIKEHHLPPRALQAEINDQRPREFAHSQTALNSAASPAVLVESL